MSSRSQGFARRRARRQSLRASVKQRQRRLLLESLEPRYVLSSSLFDHVDPQVWYPGGPSDGIDRFPVGGGSGNYNFSDNNRWSKTATQGDNLKQGDPTVLTWSIVPDGTPIDGFAGEPSAPSSLRARLQALYGGSSTGPVKDQPWYPLFVSMFDGWAKDTGLTFVHEPNDDAVAFSNSNAGVLSTRGDIRIGGHPIDGNSKILAYNFFPNFGDMVIDTNDNFFSNLSNNSIRLRNVTAHELGHGLGIAHVCPIKQTKLMEPFYTGAFTGPQHDDILAANRGYGDPFEEPRSNDAVNKATVLGSLSDGTRLVEGASIDDALDVDYFRFTVGAPKRIAITVSPVGSTYKSGPQNSDGSCSSGVDFNSKAESDLSFEVYAHDGSTLLASVNATGRGQDEVLSELRLPAAGDYFLKVKGLDKKAQLYNTTLTVSANPGAVRGLIHFQQPVYDIGQAVGIEVRDSDLIGNNTVGIQLTSPAGDTETVTLTHVNGGLYRGTIPLAAATSVQSGNGKIEANPGQVLTATYSDADTGSGSSGTATATTKVFEEICQGPDGGGYVACTAMPSFEDISQTGTAILVNEDDTTVELTDSALGSFTFGFYDTTFANAYVNSNGLISFGASPGSAPTNSDLTSSPTPATLAVYWDDIYSFGIADKVYWEVKGSGADQRLIVQWNDVRYIAGDGDGITFQAVLYAATGVIEYNYLDLDGGGTAGDNGKSASVGIKGSGSQGTRRILLANNNGPNDYVDTGKSVRISRKGILTVDVVASSVSENAGAGATQVVVTRANTSFAQALTVNLASSDTSEATVPATVTIPAGQASVTTTLDAIDDTLLDGDQTVTVTASATDLLSGTDTVTVTDYETLAMAIAAASIAENAGAAATTATVTRSNTDNSSTLTVSLASSDTSEATVPSSVTIPAGQSSVTFNIDAVDDALLDGTQTVTVTGSASGYISLADTVDVTDYETVTVAIAAASIAENAGNGATTATVTRSNTDNAAALTVNLSSSDTTEATVPASVTIPAGQASVTFSIDAVDDTLLDGTQPVTITPAATGYVAVADQVDVTDYETIVVAVAADAIAENAGAAATTATVTRSNTDNAAALTVTLTSSDTTEATVPSSVTIPAGQASATFSLDAVDDSLLDGTQQVVVTGSAANYVSITDQVDVTDYETLTIVVSAAAIAENAGAAATTATVTRSNTDNASALAVTLQSNDTSEATVPASVTIPAGQASASFNIDAVDDNLLDGTQTVTVTGSASGYVSVADQVDVTDHETVTVVIAAAAFSENAGAAASTATVTRSNTDNAAAVTVSLSSSDTSEATVPATVTIPAGQNSASFNVAAVDDSLLDGTQTVVVTPTATGYVGVADTVDVTDYETLTVVIQADSVAENAGANATTATIARSNTDRSSALTVNLTSSDTSEATVPATVTIPANAASATFNLSAVDDALLDGTQTVVIRGTASGYISIDDTVDVTDFETVTVAIAADSFLENAGANATTATVTRSNTDNAAALAVTLVNSDPTEASAPASVTIPAGQAAVSFNIGAVDDSLLDGSQPVAMNASATGYTGVSDSVDVLDYETLTVTIAADSFAENAGAGAATATVARSNTDNGAAIAVNLSSSDTTEASVSSSVTIPAGQASVTFPVDAVDDTLLDGTQTVTIRSTHAAYFSVGDTVDVLDHEELSVTVSKPSFFENDGPAAATATITRSNSDIATALTVQFASSDTTEATVPTSVTIPAGASFATVNVAAVDDSENDGTQRVTLTATASNYVPVPASVDVLDNEQIAVTITPASFGENAGAGAATGTVSRNVSDISQALVVNLASSDTTELTVPASVTIPANQKSATFAVSAVDDALLDGDQSVVVTASTSTLGSNSTTVVVADYETLSLSLSAATIPEDAGAGAATGTVTRSNTDTGAALVVSLSSSDTSEATVPSSVTIPAGQSSATFSIAAVDDSLLDGTQSVIVTASQSGYVSGTASIAVADHETLTVSIAAASFAENAGAGATTATVTRSNTDQASALVVALSSSDTTEATVPASVTIPAGQASVTFAIDAVDDALLDGTQSVTVTATEARYVAQADTVDVTDYETISVSIAAASFAENAGAAATTATVARSNTDNSAALVVNLVSSDTTEATVPASVTIPAGQAAVTLNIDAVDDTLLDGTQTVTVTGSASGYVAVADTVDVTDHETLTLVIAADSVAENAGAAATTATITRNNTDRASALVVSLASDDPSEAAVPASVTIPAGQASATFAIDAVDDALLDGTQTVTISANAAGYVGASDSLDVTDVETVTVVIAADSVAENAGAAATTATVTRSNTDNGSALVVNLASSDVSEATVPASVTIPAGQAAVTFSVDAVDDTLLDGTQTVTITALAAGYDGVADAVDVVDYETVTVVIASAAVPENAGAGATTATVTRSNTDNAAALTVSLSSSDTTEAVAPATATIPAGQASATFSVDAVDDSLLDGTQTVSISGSAGGYVSVSDSLDVTDYETLVVVIAADAIAENAGAGATTATITRSNTDNASAFTVALSSDDTTEATVPATVTIPAGQASVSFAIDAVDDDILDGTQTVAIQGTGGGYVSVEDRVDVTDYETVAVTIAAASIAENAGSAATTGTVTRSNTDNSAELIVALSSSDTSEAVVPASVTIPAGKSSVTFTVDAVDDALLDGTQTVTITGTATGYQGASDSIEVLDYETLSVSIQADSIAENAGAGAASGTITRSNSDTGSALVVNLVSSDTSELTVPPTVTIPAGQASVTFSIDAVDDTLLDGTQSVTVTGSEARYVAVPDTVDVTDYETLTVAIAAASISEQAGAGATTATVNRSNTDTGSALVVTLASSDTSEASVPTQVTIPAGQSSATFSVDAVDDALLDGTQTVTLTAAATGYVPVADRVDVTDYETLTIVVAADSIAENAGASATTATVTRSNTDNASALVVSLASSDTSEATVPSSVTIPAGKPSIAFAIDAVDDALLDGTQTVVIGGTATGYVSKTDSVAVTDHETLTLSLGASSVAENAGAGATTMTVTRSNTDNAQPLVVSLTSSDTTEASVPATATIPAGQAAVTIAVDAVDDALLDGTQAVQFRANAAGYVEGRDSLDVTDYETVTIAVASAAIREDAGSGATTATVTRSNTDNSSALVVTVASSDTTEATVPASVTIPGGASSVTFSIDAVDDDLLDGTQTVIVAGSATGYESISDQVDVTDYETVVISIAADSFGENAGAAAAQATITRSNSDNGNALEVSLSSSDTSEAVAPAKVTIPAGQPSTTFAIDAIDDTLLDGTQTVVISTSAAGYFGGNDSVDVTDYETLTVTVDADAIAENAGAKATKATLTRSNTDNAAAVTVSLTSSDTTEATVPASVTIPAGQASVTFDVDAVDDTLLDGTQTVTIQGTESRYVAVTDQVDVLDHETLTVTISKAAVVENDGIAAATATVTRSNTDTGNAIVVNVTSSDTSELAVPATVTIPAGQAAATFNLDAVDDTLLDGTQTVLVQASAGGYVSGSHSIDVTDYETVAVSLADARITENQGAGATTATITRSNTDTGSALVVTLINSDTTEASAPTSAVIPAGASSVRVDIDAVDDTILDGSQTVELRAVAEKYVSLPGTLIVDDFETLTVAVSPTSIREDAGAGAATGTVTRNNTDIGSALTVQLSSLDGSEASVPAQVVIPAGQSSATFPIDAVDDTLLDGTQEVELRASHAAYVAGSSIVSVTDVESLTLEIDLASVREDAGSGAATATLRRSNTNTETALVVSVVSSDTSELQAPPRVTIPAGSQIVSFTVDAIDDALLDGTQTVTVSAFAEKYQSGAVNVDVTDFETIVVTLGSTEIAENAGPGAVGGTVQRSNTDNGSPLTVTLTSSDVSEAVVPSTVTIPAGQSTVAFSVDIIDDDLLDGSQSVTIVPAVGGYEPVSAGLRVLDYETVTVEIEADAVSESAGSGATVATIRRSNGDNQAPLTVTLTSSDETELRVPQTIVIPGGQAAVSVALDAVDDTLLDGTQPVTVTARAGGYVDGQDGIDVRDHEELVIGLSVSAIAENAGRGAATGTVTRSNTDIANDLVVNLQSGDPTEATLPASVTIPGGQSSASFTIDAVDDALLDGTQSVPLTAVADGYFSPATTLDVTDVETLLVVLDADNISENGGETQATVTRSNTDNGSALSVQLSTSDATEATVPLTVVIPSGQSSVSFAVQAVDDDLLDGPQNVQVMARAAGYVGGVDTVQVEDDETLAVTIDRSSIAENAGSSAAMATVTRSNSDRQQPLTVSLVYSDPTELSGPLQVTIPANRASVQFALDAVDDTLLDGTQTVEVTASATGYRSIAGHVDVTDYETLTVVIDSDQVAENAGPGAATARVIRSNTDIAAPLTVRLSSSDVLELRAQETVIIAGGESSAQFSLDAIDDSLLDGDQVVIVAARAAGYESVADDVVVTDYETIAVSVSPSSVSEDAGSNAATVTITRSNTDIGEPLAVQLASSDETELVIAPTVVIPAGQASVDVPADAVDDTLLDGTQQVVLSASANAYVPGSANVDVVDHELVTVSVNESAISEFGGTATATVERSNTDVAQDLLVTIGNSDPSELALPSEVVIPAGTRAATFPISAVDDDLLDGTQHVVLTVMAVGYRNGATGLDVTDFEQLFVAFAPTEIAEHAGTGAATGTVTRGNTDIDAPLMVQLQNGDDSEIAIPGTVTIPAGQQSVGFPVDAIDDTLLDGTQTVVVSATAAGYVDGQQSIDVRDHETLVVSFDVDTIREDAGPGAARGTVRRSNTDTSDALVVTLSSSDTTELSVPNQVVIPAGTESIEFAVDAVDDTLLDGIQGVIVSAAAPGYVAGDDQLDVTDHETLSVDIASPSISEAAGAGATTMTVSRSNTDRQSSLLVTLLSSDETEAQVPVTVLIPAGAGSAVVPIDAVDDRLLDGTQQVIVSAEGPGYFGGSDSIDVTDHETLLITIDRAQVAEDAGLAAAQLTVERSNVDTDAPLQVTLQTSDPSEAVVMSQVVIPAGESSVVVPVDAVDDDLLDGTQVVTFQATADGYLGSAADLNVTDAEFITIDLADDAIAENAGVGATIARVTRSNSDNSLPLTVQLASQDESEASVPDSVVIPAGASFVEFPVDAVDDLLLDGTQTVTLTASAESYRSGSVPLLVTDAEEIRVELSRAAIREDEGAGAAVLRIARENTDRAAPLTVQLTSSDSTEAVVATQVVIPAGEASVEVPVDAVDDALLDGTQVVQIGVSASGYLPVAPLRLEVADHEQVIVTVAPSEIEEDSEGNGSAVVTVARSNDDVDEPLTVSLTGDDTEVSLPKEVVIPAGEKSASVPVTVVRDYIIDGDQVVQIIGSAAEYFDGAANIIVRDDPFPWHNDRNPYDVNADGLVSPIDILLVIEFLTGPGAGGKNPTEPPPPFYDVNNSSTITPLDALLIIDFLQRGGGSGEGEPASERDGGVDHAATARSAEFFEQLGGEGESTVAWREPAVGEALPRARRDRPRREITATVAFEIESILDEVAEDVADEWRHEA